MTADDPLGVVAAIIAAERTLCRLDRIMAANDRAHERISLRLRAERADVARELDRLREARLEQHRADIALNRAAKRRAA